jgi:hypothetical protein
LVGHARTEGRAETLLFWTLHQDDEGHQNADENKHDEQQVDADREVIDRGEGHGRRTMMAVSRLVKRGFFVGFRCESITKGA